MNTRKLFWRSEDGRAWRPIGIAELKVRLESTYQDVNAAIKSMRDGQEIRTIAACYKYDFDPDVRDQIEAMKIRVLDIVSSRGMAGVSFGVLKRHLGIRDNE